MPALTKTHKESRWIDRLSASIVNRPDRWLWLCFVLLYAGTCARDLLAADSGEFQLIAAQWGIAHPPGYALYTIVGALWVRLVPISSIAFRLNLLSAVLAATTLAFTFNAMRTWQKHWGISQRTRTLTSLLATITLGVSTTFWVQATTANIRMPAMLFTAWAYLILAQWRSSDHDQAALIKLAVVTGLGVGHHPSLVFVALGWVLYIALCDIKIVVRVRQWFMLVLVTVLAWAIPQVYLPIRGSMAGVLFAPDNIATWRGFWFHVLAKGFAGDMFAFLSAPDLALRLPLFPSLLTMQFAPIWLALMAAGVIWLGIKQPRITASLVLSWLIHSLVTITYRAPQTVEYLMPAYIPMVIVLALSMGSMIHVTSQFPGFMRRAGQITTGLLLLVLLIGIPHTASEFATTANNTSIRERVQPLLEQAALYDSALIMADWRWATPLWYLQQVEHIGEHVAVEYILPEAEKAYDAVWQETAQANIAESLFSTHFYRWPGWEFAPLAGGFQVYQMPVIELAATLPYSPLDVTVGPIKLLGYQVHGDAQPGGLLHMNLAWHFTEDTEAIPSFATRLWSVDGALMGISDQWLGDIPAGNDVHFSRFTYMLPIDQCSAINPTVGVYTVDNGSFIDLGNVTIPALPMDCTWPTLPVEHTAYGVLTGRGPFLTGLDYDTGVQGITYAYTRWCGPGSAVNLHNSQGQVTVQALAPGACQTVRLPVDAQAMTGVTFTYLDGKPASLIALPLRSPKPGERYTPFSKDIVLVGTRLQSGPAIVHLDWRTASPIVDDYAISVRLLGSDESGEWRLVHDMQPGLGAIPTLKWAKSGLRISDPHPFEAYAGTPAGINVTVYERFQLTPVSTLHGDVVKYQLP